MLTKNTRRKNIVARIAIQHHARYSSTAHLQLVFAAPIFKKPRVTKAHVRREASPMSFFHLLSNVIHNKKKNAKKKLLSQSHNTHTLKHVHHCLCTHTTIIIRSCRR